MSDIDFTELSGWKADTWDKNTEATKYIAVNEFDTEVILFLKDKQIAADEWHVCVGVSLKDEHHEKITEHTLSLDDAKQKAYEFMCSNQKVTFGKELELKILDSVVAK